MKDRVLKLRAQRANIQKSRDEITRPRLAFLLKMPTVLTCHRPRRINWSFLKPRRFSTQNFSSASPAPHCRKHTNTPRSMKEVYGTGKGTQPKYKRCTKYPSCPIPSRSVLTHHCLPLSRPHLQRHPSPNPSKWTKLGHSRNTALMPAEIRACL